MFLEIRHLRSLLAIRETGNLARAAERLHVTQSALSHQIKSLEQYFEAPLFLRNSKPLRLTPAGEKLIGLARQVLPLVEGAENDLRRVARGELGRLHIAIECHACFEWLAPVLNRYRQQWPQIEVDIRVGVSFEALPALQKGEVDLVISSDPLKSTDLQFAELFDYEALLVMPADHPLTRKKRIQPADLAGETLITYPVNRQRLDVFSRFLQPAGVEPAAVRQSELTSVILLLVASGRGVAVLPDWVLREAEQAGTLATRPLGPRGMKGMLYAAVRRAEFDTAYLQDFIELARRR
ncbi:MAG TPA: LysR family transcriptional regulator [Chromatiales bacterium]|nr:LysR family transcriptional regulator [Chromatiales bacterium]HEX22353.1 LysR family transcriptional regulator [Chromatiales bacterium]